MTSVSHPGRKNIIMKTGVCMEEEVLTFDHCDLRFGYIADIFYRVTNRKMPKQLDLLETWFPGVIIQVKESDGEKKITPVYDEKTRFITACRYHGYLYSGGLSGINQLAGRLIGTASSNAEKERRNAVLIRKRIARDMATDMNIVSRLHENISAILETLDEQELNDFHYILYRYTIDLAFMRSGKTELEIDEEAFPMDDEVFDGVIYNTVYQLKLFTFENLVCAWLWMLSGSLLRNETGRLLRLFDSSWNTIYRHPSETPALLDKLDYLLFPENYESFYAGDDLDKRFPGIDWYCTSCGAHLNDQDGFSDHLPVWQCRQCGYLNPIDADHIYDTLEDAENNRPANKAELLKAIEERRNQPE